MARVFISYRRVDSAAFSGRIYDRLVVRYGRRSVFKDVDDIPAGVDFPDYIQQSLRRCAVVLVVIGPRWLEARDTQGGRRLDDPADFVRLEIETALALGLTVIPLLVDGAHMPATAHLPEPLQHLTRINALTVRNDPDFSRDMERVLTAVDHAIAKARPAGGGWFGRNAHGVPCEPAAAAQDAAAAADAAHNAPAHPLSAVGALGAGVAHEAAAARASTPAGSVASAPALALPLSAPSAEHPRSSASLAPRLLLIGLAGVVVVASFVGLFYASALNRNMGRGAGSAAQTQTAYVNTMSGVENTAVAEEAATTTAVARYDATALPYTAQAPGLGCDPHYGAWQVTSRDPGIVCSPDHTQLNNASVQYDLGAPLVLRWCCPETSR